MGTARVLNSPKTVQKWFGFRQDTKLLVTYITGNREQMDTLVGAILAREKESRPR